MSEKVSFDINRYQDQLTILTKDRATLTNKKLEYTDQLKTTKRGQGLLRLKKAIKEVDQSIKRLDNQIDDISAQIARLEKIQNDEILADQGIDSRTARTSAMWQGISDTTKGVAELAGNIMGQGGISGIQQQKQISKADIEKAKQETEQTAILAGSDVEKTKTKSSSLVYIAIAVVVVLFLMMKKK